MKTIEKSDTNRYCVIIKKNQTPLCRRLSKDKELSYPDDVKVLIYTDRDELLFDYPDIKIQ